MKTIYQPAVYLIGAQVIDEHELDLFLELIGVPGWETDTAIAPEKLVELGGRVCYMSFRTPRPGGNSAYLSHIKEVGHGSVLEHAVYTFIIANVSRSLSHELVRHRAGFSPSQLSQRYVSEADGEFVMPREIQGDGDLESIWAESCRISWEAYKRLVCKLDAKIGRRAEYECQHCRNITGIACEKCRGTKIDPDKRTEVKKAARGAARSVLPNATETKLLLTGNARAWRHFLEQRASIHADAEIRSLAIAVWRALKQHSPHIFGDYTARSLDDGTAELFTQYRKV